MQSFGLTPIDRLLWFCTIGANISILYLLIRGRHFRLFPLFLCYNCFALLKSLTLVSVRFLQEPNAYFFVYYVGSLFSTALLVLVTLEIASDIFAPYNTIPVKNVINLLGASMVAGIFALAISEFAGYHPEPQWWDRILVMEKFSRFLIFAGLGVIAYVTYEMGLPCFKHNRGLACGLAFATLMQGILSVLNNPQDHAKFSRPFTMLAFIVAQAVWMHTFSDKWVVPEMPTIAQLKEQSETFSSVCT